MVQTLRSPKAKRIRPARSAGFVSPFHTAASIRRPLLLGIHNEEISRATLVGREGARMRPDNTMRPAKSGK
ncbi:hypothetical protein F8B43_5578 [Methylorubrum populi]|uniref:Uncharacterized protein n=1 Tax=Methylorubrum populi TaxID=223967 RepID=A0A833J0N8_9HYPH|nr:hypothetical protein F8B43_5578 [Methylorubrum populi]